MASISRRWRPLPTCRTLVIVEPLLQLIAESVDRIVEQAHASICEHRIGVFDQAKVNSFVADGDSAKTERILMVKLKKRTFREYKNLWKRLLCFVCRTSQLDVQAQLPHQFTTSQLFHIRNATSYVQELLLLLSTDTASSHFKQRVRVKTKKEIEADLDKVCLLLCIPQGQPFRECRAGLPRRSRY